MLKVDPSLTHVPARRGHVVALHESINQPLVNIPGRGVAPTGAFVLGTKNDHGAFTVFVYLYQPESAAALLYVSDPRALSEEPFRREEAEAVRFVESMGFLLDDVHFTRLPPAEQDAVIERVPLFRPPAYSEPRSSRSAGVVTGRPTADASGFSPLPASGAPLTLSAPAALGPGSPPLSPAPSSPPPTLAPEPPRAVLGRGLGPAGPRARPSPDALARLGRLLGTFSVLVALGLGGAGCAGSRPAAERQLIDAELDLGHQELGRGGWADGLRHFQRVLEVDATHAEAHRGAGLALWRLGRLEQSESHLRRAVDGDEGRWSEPKNDLAVVLIERGECAEARELLLAALEDVFYAHPHFAEHNLARAEACSGDIGAAVDRLRRLVAQRPKFCLGYLTASSLAASEGLHEATIEACEGFRAQCERDSELGSQIPEDVKAACDERRGRAYLALGDVESARAAYRRCAASESVGRRCRVGLDTLPP